MKYLLFIFVLFFFSGCDQLLEDTQTYTFVSHNQGQSCLNCHSEFSGGGTIYKYVSSTTADNTTIPNNHTIKLTLADNSVITMLIGNGSGNFRTKATISQSFTASIIDETGATIRTSGTHQSTSTNCNSCHTSSGLNSAPGRIYTTDATSSTTDTSSIIYKSHNQGADCLSCHNGSNQIEFTLAGTIYTTINATTANSASVATNYTARLTLADGTKLIMGVAKGNGNIYYEGVVGQTFTVEILDLNGKVVNSSSTHDLTSISCNVCHTSSGLNNAPGRIYITEPLITSTSTYLENDDDEEDD